VLQELRRAEIRFCPGMQQTIQISKYEYYQSRGYGSLRGRRRWSNYKIVTREARTLKAFGVRRPRGRVRGVSLSMSIVQGSGEGLYP